MEWNLYFTYFYKIYCFIQGNEPKVIRQKVTLHNAFAHIHILMWQYFLITFIIKCYIKTNYSYQKLFSKLKFFFIFLCDWFFVNYFVVDFLLVSIDFRVLLLLWLTSGSSLAFRCSGCKSDEFSSFVAIFSSWGWPFTLHFFFFFKLSGFISFRIFFDELRYSRFLVACSSSVSPSDKFGVVVPVVVSSSLVSLFSSGQLSLFSLSFFILYATLPS